MSAKLPWVDRKFSFDFPVAIYPDVVERFRGLPARIEDRTRGLPRDILTKSDGGWSIQENVGHLLDMEPLWDARMDDFLAGKPTLRAADITNPVTNNARHNDKQIQSLLATLRAARLAQVARLERMNESDFARVSEHPRLKQKLRLIDALTFVCAHDDYHMARIAELIKKFE